MKKKKKNWLKIILITCAILFVVIEVAFIVVNIFTSNIDNLNEADINYYFEEYKVDTQNLTAYVKGTGEITSFNIKNLDIPSYSDIKETFVSDGEIVTAKQKILRGIINGYNQNITSPIDGMYFEVENNGLKQYQIYDLKNIGIEMYVSENDVAMLTVGQKASVHITALNKDIEGSVSYIAKLPTDGKFKVKIKIDYNDEIKFGYGVSVKVIVAEKTNVLVIPYTALQMDDDNKYYVIKSEHKLDYYKNILYKTDLPEKAKNYVEIGIIANNQVEIISGLNAGDIIEEWN